VQWGKSAAHVQWWKANVGSWKAILKTADEKSGRPERGKTNIGTYLYLYEDLISEYIYV
jgi:hypothetical protein